MLFVCLFTAVVFIAAPGLSLAVASGEAEGGEGAL